MAPQFWAHLLIIGLILLGNGIYFAERLTARPPMKRETLIWTMLFVAGGLFLLYRARVHRARPGEGVRETGADQPESETDLRMKFVDARPTDEEAVAQHPAHGRACGSRHSSRWPFSRFCTATTCSTRSPSR